jgi:hypothetical protein
MDGIKCKASNDIHIFEDPVELPCKITIGRRCFQINQLCFNCNEEHNIQELKTNELADGFIKDNFKKLRRNFENNNSMDELKVQSK